MVETDLDPLSPLERPVTTLPRSYWIVAVLLLLWGLGYLLLVAEALFIMRPEDYGRLVNAGYGDYVQHLPGWIVGLTVFKAGARVTGALGLLLRRQWAVPMYGFSLAAGCIIFSRGFLLDDRAAVELPAQIGLDVLFFLLAIYAVYFSIAARLRGVLR